MAIAGTLFNSSDSSVLIWNLYWTETETSINVKFKATKAAVGTLTVKINGTSRLSQTFNSLSTGNIYDLCTINKTKSTQTLTYSVSHSAAQSGNYTGSSPNGSTTIPSKTSYPVTYASNVTTLTDATQTKWYDEDLELKGSVQYSGYTFLGWNTEEDWSGTTYGPSSTYADNAPLTLYAMFALNPKLTSIDVHRCDYSSPTTIADEGEYAALSFVLSRSEVITSCEYTVGVYNNLECLSSQRIGNTISRTITRTQEGTGSETISENVTVLTASSSSYKLDVNTRYYVKITVNGVYNSSYYTESNTYIVEVPTAFFTMDVKAGGHGIAFGGPATENAFLNYFESKFFADVMFETMIGVIQMFGGETPPNGWLICDGSYVSKTTYSKLWQVLGDAWGPSKSTTFALPDFRGRGPIGTKLPSSHSETYPNLIRDDTCAWVSEEYRPYIYYMSENMTVSTQYTLQMWDVDVMCAGSNNRDASNIGICVYWGGGSVELISIWADRHITYSATLGSYNVSTVSSRQIDSSSVLYHFPYLEVVFTTSTTAGAAPEQIHVYNSYPSSTETRYMKIGKVQLTKGSNLGIPWNASEFIHGHNKDKLLGSIGGSEGITLTVDQMPSHTHGLNNHVHSVGGHSHPFGGTVAVNSGNWSGEAFSGTLSGTGATLYYRTSSQSVSNKTSTNNNTAFNTGGNTGSTTASGNGQLISVLEPYATVNFIICTGVLS